MRPFRSAVICICFTLVVRGVCADDAVPAVMPATVERIPGTFFQVATNLDGSAVCCTTDGVFASVADLHRWSAIPNLPREIRGFCLRPVGGDRTRFFVEGDMYAFKRQIAEGHHAPFGDYYSLAAIDAGGNLSVAWDKRPGGGFRSAAKVAAFASKDVGCVGWSEDVMGAHGGLAGVRNNLALTADAGATWKFVPPPAFAAKFVRTNVPNLNQPVAYQVFERISGLLWVSPSRLLVAGSGGWASGSLQLYEYKEGDILRLVWSADVEEIDKLLLDGDYVWVASTTRERLERLALADGHVCATVMVNAPDRKNAGMYDWKAAACHQCLIAWGSDHFPSFGRIHHGLDGFKTMEEASAAFMKEDAANAPKPQLDIWVADPKLGYARRARIAAPSIAAILPLAAPLCLMISTNGEGFHLDLHKGTLSRVGLQVTPLPPPPPPLVNPNFATPEQLKAMVELAVRVPKADRFAIFEAANKRADLTPKQEVELVTRQLREYIASKKPGPVVEPPTPTGEEMRTMQDLAEQVPGAKQRAIVIEASRKTELTDRDRVLWITQRYRKYLEQATLKPNRRTQPAGDDDKGGSPDRPGKE